MADTNAAAFRAVLERHQFTVSECRGGLVGMTADMITVEVRYALRTDWSDGGWRLEGVNGERLAAGMLPETLDAELIRRRQREEESDGKAAD